MASFSVTQPTAARASDDEIVFQVKAGEDYLALHMSPNDVLEAIQQLSKAMLPLKKG